MSLEDVYEAYRLDRAFDALRQHPGVRLVPGVGARRPKVMLVGEAPGAVENTRGEPFCGPSGRVLRQLMGEAGLSLKDTDVPDDRLYPANSFITNVVKYRPPGNRTPTLHEIEASRPYLRREWYALGLPRVLVALGATAKVALMDGGPAVTKLIGRPCELPGGEEGKTRWLWVMYHPAFIMRQRQMREEYEATWMSLGLWLQEQQLLT